MKKIFDGPLDMDGANIPLEQAIKDILILTRSPRDFVSSLVNACYETVGDEWVKAGDVLYSTLEEMG